MRIILANRYFHPDQSATSRMTTSLALALSEAGHEVIALTSRLFHDRSDARLPPLDIAEGIRIVRIATTRFGRGSVPGRFIDYASYHVTAALWLLRNARRGDICIMCTDPPMLSVSAALPLRFRGAKLVNWLMDLFPEVAIDLGVLPERNAGARACMMLRDWSLRMAARNVCPIDTMERYLNRRGIARQKTCVAHHWSEGDELRPVARHDNALRRAWGFGDELVVGYSGNFGRAHDFSTILDAAEKLRNDERIRFLLIGDGKRKTDVEAEVEERRLTNVIMKPLQPRERLAESLSVADIHLVSLLPALERSVIPSKLYGALAVGRPVLFIGDRLGEVASVIASGDCGSSVSIGDCDTLADIIRSLRDAPDALLRWSENARHTFEAGYTRQAGVSRWRAVLAQISNEWPEPTVKVEHSRIIG